MHPKANTHIHCQHTHSRNTNTCMHKHLQRHTDRHQRTQQALGVMPWPLVPSQRGAVHQHTTAPLIPSAPLVNFALSPRASEEPSVVSWKGGGGVEGQGQRSEATVCVRPLNHCVCMKAGIVRVSLCMCVCGVWPSTVHVRIKRAENKGPLVWDENIDQCYRPNKINWSNGHTYFHYSASLLQPGENRLATTNVPAAMTSWWRSLHSICFLFPRIHSFILPFKMLPHQGFPSVVIIY